MYKVYGVFAGEELNKDSINLGEYHGMNQLEAQLPNNKDYKDIFDGVGGFAAYKITSKGSKEVLVDGELGIMQIRTNKAGDQLYIVRA